MVTTLILAPILVPVGTWLGCNELHMVYPFVSIWWRLCYTPPFGYNLFAALSISNWICKQLTRDHPT
ncbi:TRAP transporter large permease subunit [Oscillospiraceae bacterium LTW-04]